MTLQTIGNNIAVLGACIFDTTSFSYPILIFVAEVKSCNMVGSILATPTKG